MEIFSHWHVHPKVVHFPIALFISALGLQIFSFILKKESLHKTAFHIYTLATILTPLVVQTGLWEEKHLNLHHPVMGLHEKFALLTMWTSLAALPILLFVRKISLKSFKIMFFIILILIVVSVSMAAHQGGIMVYEYAIGVEQ